MAIFGANGHADFSKRRPVPNGADTTKFVPNDDGRTDVTYSNVVVLFSGTGLTPDMKDSILFKGADKQYDWFMAKKTEEVGGRYVNITEGYVDVPFQIEDLTDVDYLTFQENTYPTTHPDDAGHNQLYYCFVTNMARTHMSDNSTRVYFQVDPIQTFMFRFRWQNAFIERFSVPRQESSVDKPLINTVDEAVYAGLDYRVIQTQGVDTKESDETRIKKVLVLITTIGFEELNTNGYKTTYTQLKKVGTKIQNVDVPLNVYLMAVSDSAQSSILKDILSLFNQDKRFANKIVACFITDLLTGVIVSGNDLSSTSDVKMDAVGSGSMFDGSFIYKVKSANTERLKPGTTFDAIKIGGEYLQGTVGLTNPDPKLLMPPFFKMRLTDFQGDQVDLYPALFEDMHNINFTQLAPLGVSSKYGAYPNNYLGTSGMNKFYGAINNHVNHIPTTASSSATYFQAHENALGARKAKNTGDATYAQSYANISGLTNIAKGVTGAVAGNPSAVIGGLGSAVTDNIRGDQAQYDALMSNNLIDAQAKDAGNLPASVSEMGGDPFYELGINNGGFYVQFLMPPVDYIKRLDNYFSVMGTKEQRIITGIKDKIINENNKHTYIKASTPVIQGNFNSEAKKIINDCFTKGIRFWSEDIGVGDASQPN